MKTWSCSTGHVFPILIYLHSKSYGNQWGPSHDSTLPSRTPFLYSFRDRAIFFFFFFHFWLHPKQGIPSYFLLSLNKSFKRTENSESFWFFVERYRFHVFWFVDRFLSCVRLGTNRNRSRHNSSVRSCVIIDFLIIDLPMKTSGTCAAVIRNLIIDFVWFLFFYFLKIWSSGSRGTASWESKIEKKFSRNCVSGSSRRDERLGVL